MPLPTTEPVYSPGDIAEAAGAAHAYYKFAQDNLQGHPQLLNWFGTRIPPEAAELVRVFNEASGAGNG